MNTRTVPLLEALEDRVVPTVYGTPWPDAEHLTVSFAPDGTVIGDSTSNLFATFDTPEMRDIWQEEILKALQAWASVANVDLTVVTDDGSAFGTGGALQGDPRFGDLRIGGIGLGANSVSTAVPYNPSAGTWSGDILFNTDVLFSTIDAEDSFDLYSIALHEAGHAFGLGGTVENPASALFEYYNGKRTTLAAADVAAMRTLYGARQADEFEGIFGNNQVLTATGFLDASRQTYLQALSRAETVHEALLIPRLSFHADLTTAGDDDWYWYHASGSDRGFTLTLRTGGVSLANARLTVYDVLGRVVGQGSTTSTGEVSVTTNGRALLGIYLFRIDSAPGSAFNTGRYELSLAANSPSVASQLLPRFTASAAHDNDSFATASTLDPARQHTRERPTFFAQGSLDHAGDVDVYRVQTPRNGTILLATLQLADTAQDATLELYDSAGNTVATTPLAAGSGTVVLRAEGLRTGRTYFLRVAGTSATSEPGRYSLVAQFNVPVSAPTSPVLGGTINADSPQTFHGVVLATTTLLTLDVEVAAAEGVVGAIEVALYDANGTILATQVVTVGSRARFQLLLGPGAYNLRFVGGLENADSLGSEELTYSVSASMDNDPIGPRLLDPGSPPPPRNLIPDWLPDALVTIISLFDPYGRPYGSDLPPKYY